MKLWHRNIQFNLGCNFNNSTVVEFGQALYNYAKHSHKRTNKK